MQYAQVIVNRPSSKTYSYAISAQDLPYINIGTIVEVDFGRTTVYAVVIALRKNTPDLEQGSLRTIKRIAAEFRAPHLCQALSRYLEYSYLCGAQKGYFSWLGSSLPKKISKQTFAWQEPVAKAHAITNINISAADLKKDVFRLVQKGIKQGKSVRIITGTIDEYNLIASTINKSIKEVPVALSVRLNTTQHYRLLKSIAINCPDIIIGTRSLALIPPRKNELWLIINPLAGSAWEQRHPNYSILGLSDFYQRYCKIVRLFYYTPPYIKPVLHSREGLPFAHRVSLMARPSPPHYQEKVEALLSTHRVNLFVPKFYRQKIFYCLKCDSALKSSCCAQMIILGQQDKMICRQCLTLQSESRCQICHSSQIIPKQNYFIQKIIDTARDKKITIKMIYTNDLLISETQDGLAILFGFDYLLESVDFYASEQWLKNIAVATQTHPKTIVISDLIESAHSKNLQDLAHELFHEKLCQMMPPFGKALMINLQKYQNMDELCTQLESKLAAFDPKLYRHPRAPKIALLIKHQDWPKLHKALTDNRALILNNKMIKSIDIDPHYFI